MSWELDRRPPPAHRGFTLVEMMVSLSVVILLMGSTFAVLSISMGSYAEGDSVADMETGGRRVLDRIAEDLRPGIMATMTPTVPAASTSLSLAPAVEYAGGTVVQGTRVGYDLRADPQDPPNGKDDDHDGLIDEKTVVRTEGGVETVIAANVKDLRFTLSGRHIITTVTIERVIRGKRTITFTDSIQIRIRN
jgi:prepilin-type N-terminal cleavage/methylation domain-containing protein